MTEPHQIASDEAPFALSFEGFVDQSQIAEQRFRAFCLHDLNLSVEETERMLSQPGVSIICSRSSLRDPSVLAEIFEGLGARVSILAPHDGLCETVPEQPELSAISAQLSELLQAPSLGLAASTTIPRDFVLTLNSSHGAHGVQHSLPAAARASHDHDRRHHTGRAVRDLPAPHHSSAHSTIIPAKRHHRSRSIRIRSVSRRKTSLNGVQMIGMLIVGVAVLIGTNRIFIGKPGLRSVRSNVPLTREHGITDSRAPAGEAPLPSTREYDGTVTRPNYTLTVSARTQGDSVSTRVLLITPMHIQPIPQGDPGTPTLRRIESDMTLLDEGEEGIWSGRLVSYLFIEQEGVIRRVPAITEVSLRTAANPALATVTISATLPDRFEGMGKLGGIPLTEIEGEPALIVRDHVSLSN